MKSIKPGRGPSKRSFAGSIFVVVFGIIWTILAASICAGAGIIGILFPLFGVCFVGFGIYDAYIAYQNAHGEDRMSLYDIVDGNEEPDPFAPDYEQRKAQQRISAEVAKTEEALFCPYCGKAVEPEHNFCKYCGKPLE